MYFKTLLKRAWADTAQFVKEHILSEALFAFVIAAVGYVRGDMLSQILSPLVYGLGAAALIALAALSYNLLLAPARIYYEQQIAISALREQLKPTLQIEFKEDDDTFYHESQWFHELSDSLSTSRKGLVYWRLCRIAIKNLSKSASIENVQVRLTSIEPTPKELKGKLPLHLRFMNDNVQPYKQSIDLNPNSVEFVDVVGWRWERDREMMQAKYFIYHSVAGIDADFPVDDYKITVEASGRNSTCKPKSFSIGMRNKDGTTNKLWMSESPLQN